MRPPIPPTQTATHQGKFIVSLKLNVLPLWILGGLLVFVFWVGREVAGCSQGWVRMVEVGDVLTQWWVGNSLVSESGSKACLLNHC